VYGDEGPPLRGRDDERAALDNLRHDVLSGRSATLVIRGEPGVGKSALLRYVAARAATDFLVAEISGVESEAELAYAGLHQLCARMLDDLDALPHPQRSALSVAFGLSDGTPPDRFLVGLATLSLLAHQAEHRPLLCIIDDAQWLDDASSQVFGFVARRLGAESVALIFAVREGRDPHRFAGLPEMRVEGVSDEDARALLATVVPGRLDERVRDRIVAETGGNPLALLELPRGMSAAELAGGFGLPDAGGVPAQIEVHYVNRIRALPESTQQLMLLAAADSVGDATTVWRAADTLGIRTDAVAPAASEHLLEIGSRVRFRHPLVRSAVYRSASDPGRRAAHRALALATDPETDPDRRAWHRAHASVGHDSEIAAELEACASRAQTRGGLASAAALLERAAALTPDPSTRVERKLAAANAKLRAGAFDGALALLAEADSEATDELTRARVESVRAFVVSSSSTGSEAPLRLLEVARRLVPLDLALARQAFLAAWGAALFAGHLASPGGNIVDVSRAARNAPRPTRASSPFDALLDGLSLLITESRAAAASVLAETVHALLSDDVPVEDWLHWGVLASSAAVTLWDFDAWNATSSHQIDLARDVGALAMLSVALNGQAMIAVWQGDLESAATLVAEDTAIKEATGSRIAPYGAMLLAAYQGRVNEASTLIAETIEDSVARGEGLGVDLAKWTAAILNNGASQYEEALSMASPTDPMIPGLYISAWMLPERIEAAVRCGRTDLATAALRELVETANPSASNWGLGIEARGRAMLSEGGPAEAAYRDAIDYFARTPIRTELARAHLVFGEWLRRENRRVDAREQLRTAHDMFLEMGANGFAERTRRELVATGEHVRKRADATRTQLTGQEDHIARLARDGRTNSEIAAELFISGRTVEWHLRKVYSKLGITSRRELKDALPARATSA
jgi:DNA-binding CsgD family transcriptional regulator